MNSAKFKLAAAGLALAVALGASGAFAQEGDSKAVARVNGHEITVKEVELASDDLRPQLEQVPANLRFPFVVEYLIERHLLAQQAVKENITETDEYKRRLKFYQAKALRDAYFTNELAPSVTEDKVKEAYEREAVKVKSEKRARARHILVATEQEAKDVVQRLQAGEKFEEVARQVSLDGSREYGGDLGFFTAGEMVPEFSKAVFSLKKGDVSQPVKTDFGWHVIKLEDIQESGPQPFEQVQTPIRLVLLRKAVQDKVLELRGSGKIEILDEDLKKLQEEADKKRQQIDAQRQQQQGSGSQQSTTSGGKGDRGSTQ